MKASSEYPREPKPGPNAPTAKGPGGFSRFLSRSLGRGEPFRAKETTVVLAISLFLVLVCNTVFFAKVLAIYPPGFRYLIFHAGLFAIVVTLTAFVLNLAAWKHTIKPVAALLFIASSVVCYFVNTYGIVVDDDMLRNVMETNPAESLDLMSAHLGLYVLFLGVLPARIVWRLQVEYGGFLKNLLRKAALAGSCLVVIIAALFGSASTFASFLREHKPVRAYFNPLGYIYAVGKLIGSRQGGAAIEVRPYAEDARRIAQGRRPRLVILVVGETARADRFSLNGYARETNPLLKREDIVNFTNVMAAGTSTTISVPSMFSHLTRENYSARVARNTENILDILARTGVSVLWRDNNSDSKGVALRVPYEDFKTSDRNPICDDECRDEGMLAGLQEYIDRRKDDVQIVLHQMGSHGPAYYKRYPKAFEVFTPVCRSNRLEQCSSEEINNAYDNTILYTDYFLSKVIGLLKHNDDRFETAMLYFSDHGESLGEHNMYLHGYPYALAPMEQKHIPAVFWFGRNFSVDRVGMRAKAGEPYSHDYLFHTLLGLFGVQTDAYRAELDMVSPFLVKTEH